MMQMEAFAVELEKIAFLQTQSSTVESRVTEVPANLPPVPAHGVAVRAPRPAQPPTMPTPPPPVSAPLVPAPVRERMASLGEAAKAVAPYGAGAALGAGVAGALALRKMPGVRAQLKAELKARMKGTTARAVHESKELGKGQLHPGAVANAQAIAAEIRRQGIDPKKVRIAVSGTGGTGKSTLAQALAQELGLKHFGLDAAPYGMNLRGRTLTKYIRQHPEAVKPGTVAEQTHLINKVKPGTFDIVIHMQKPMSQIKKQIIKRQRGAGQIDTYRYKFLDRMLSRSFDSLEGTTLKPVEGIRMKIAPAGGFTENEINRQLRQMGIKKKVIRKMRRDDKLTTLESGRLTGKGTYGWHYVNKKKIVGGIAAPIAGGAAGAASVEGVRRAGVKYRERQRER